MDDHYPCHDFQQHFHVQSHVPIAQDIPYRYGYYAHSDDHMLATPTSDAMNGVIPMPSNAAIKGHYFPIVEPLQYTPLHHNSATAYWGTSSEYDENLRSVSPQTDCQSNSRAPTLIYDDAMSSRSGFESSPSPYPEPVSMTSYKQESMSPLIEHVQPMPQQGNPMFSSVYAGQQPSEYSAPPTSSPSEPPKSSRRASARKGKARNGVQKRNGKSPKKTPARPSRAEPVTTSKQSLKKTADRRFECTFARYGCASTFPSKNEWKRHVSSQHIQPGFYRCDVGRCNLNNIKNRTTSPNCQTQSSPSPASPNSQHPAIPITPTLVNDFNRKDLFIQHQRRMHAPWVANTKTCKQSVSQAEKEAFEMSLDGVWKRCWQQLRTPPTLSHCGFCDAEFRGINAWRERMEHVARHYEQADPGPEKEDLPLREWALENGVIVHVNGEWKLASLCRE
ncbi:putative C2H2 finger domain protein [Aspergillus puulaauensis]|uniref:C2H2 finger domain protein n=1 Tax=Aspergillus puulaauensis TaxID=1220207 RepID=A0A7R8AUN9_9EURO|nr:uncharacterized protein APUU_80373S [Aspergillus puulaauensis]BCS30070.1 hypothetical protein APUU_80373S [Aspergillus puulaauensis]